MNEDKVIRYVDGVPTLVSPKLEQLCTNTELNKIKSLLAKVEK